MAKLPLTNLLIGFSLSFALYNVQEVEQEVQLKDIQEKPSADFDLEHRDDERSLCQADIQDEVR